MKPRRTKPETNPENTQDETLRQEFDDMEETSRRNKRLNIFIAVFSVVCALSIWLYASAITETEAKLQSVVNVKYVSAAEEKGFDVEYNTELKINFVLGGKVLAISQIPNYGLNVYADLSSVNFTEITNTKTVQLPLIFDLPEGITCIEKSQEYIEVTITKRSNG